jgi:hypothetical protein
MVEWSAVILAIWLPAKAARSPSMSQHLIVPGTITNEAQATSDVFDPDLSNNTAMVETVVEEPPTRKLFLPLVSAP